MDVGIAAEPMPVAWTDRNAATSADEANWQSRVARVVGESGVAKFLVGPLGFPGNAKVERNSNSDPNCSAYFQAHVNMFFRRHTAIRTFEACELLHGICDKTASRSTQAQSYS